MSTTSHVPDHEEPLSAGLSALIILIGGGIVWVFVILAVRWFLGLPPDAELRLVAFVLLVLGAAVLCYALVKFDVAVPARRDGPGGATAVVRREEPVSSKGDDQVVLTEGRGVWERAPRPCFVREGEK